MWASSCLHGRPRNLPTPEEGNGLAIFTRSRNRANLRAPSMPSKTECLSDFMEYVSRTWVHCNASWPPSCWSVYLCSVRANNNVEGWHHSLNRHSHGKTQLPFYVLTQLLHEEAKLISLQIHLVSERKLKRMQHSVYCQLQSRIFTLWEEYKSGKRTSKLLQACARLYGPRNIEFL